MDKEQIRHITTARYGKLKKHIKKIIADFDEEAIHEYRVEYKMLRAFFRMLATWPHEEIKITKKLKKSYRLSGKIRDLQLYLERIQEAAKGEKDFNDELHESLKSEMHKLKEDLIELLSENPVAECKKKTDALLPPELNISAFRLFIRKKWMAINAIISSANITDDNIHLIRKYLKDLLYSLELYGGAEDEKLSRLVFKNRDEEYFDNLLDDLGNFQDMRTAITILIAHLPEDADNQDFLIKTKKSWMKLKLSIKRSLVKKIEG